MNSRLRREGADSTSTFEVVPPWASLGRSVARTTIGPWSCSTTRYPAEVSRARAKS
jgi:hypothetical protein